MNKHLISEQTHVLSWKPVIDTGGLFGLLPPSDTQLIQCNRCLTGLLSWDERCSGSGVSCTVQLKPWSVKFDSYQEGVTNQQTSDCQVLNTQVTGRVFQDF